jgi:hypothetical protein
VAFGLYKDDVMKKRTLTSTEPKIVLSWLFRQQDRLLTCGISQAAGAAFEVVTVPHWDLNRGTVERFTGAMKALERHAEISSALRTAGWAPASYTR